MNSDFQIKLFKLMERVWLVGVLIGIAGVVYFLIQKDNFSFFFESKVRTFFFH